MSQRPYRSAVRTRQATETRNKIAREAERLFVEHGYEHTTVGAVAAAAGVAPQTVYAVFGSKKGILKALIEQLTAEQNVLETYRLAMQSADPRVALSHIAALVCYVYESMGHLHEMLRGSVATSPELHQLMREQQNGRRELQKEFIGHLFNNGHIRPDFTFDVALDTLWCLLNRESYRLLVEERGWSRLAYQHWLGDQLSRMLLH